MSDVRREKSGWRSSLCADSACVEVMDDDGQVLLRSSLHPGTVLRLTSAEWSAFLAGMKQGDFD